MRGAAGSWEAEKKRGGAHAAGEPREGAGVLSGRHNERKTFCREGHEDEQKQPGRRNTERTLGQGKLKNLQRGHRAECSLEAGRGGGGGCSLGCFITTWRRLKKRSQLLDGTGLQCLPPRSRITPSSLSPPLMLCPSSSPPDSSFLSLAHLQLLTQWSDCRGRGTKGDGLILVLSAQNPP